MHRKKASDALWFAATYGLMPESLVLSDDGGQLHSIEVNGSSSEGKPTFYWSPLLFHLRISNMLQIIIFFHQPLDQKTLWKQLTKLMWT